MLIKRNAMGRQRGFTLIELIVVMMILAILVATAAPKFLNFQVDARNAALNGLKSAIESGAQLVYGKAAIGGIERDPTGALGVSPNDVALVFGYPAATENGIIKAISGVGNVANVDNYDWKIMTTPPLAQNNGSLSMSFASGTTACYVTYNPATISAPARTTVTDCV